MKQNVTDAVDDKTGTRRRRVDVVWGAIPTSVLQVIVPGSRREEKLYANEGSPREPKDVSIYQVDYPLYNTIY